MEKGLRALTASTPEGNPFAEKVAGSERADTEDPLGKKVAGSDGAVTRDPLGEKVAGS